MLLSSGAWVFDIWLSWWTREAELKRLRRKGLRHILRKPERGWEWLGGALRSVRSGSMIVLGVSSQRLWVKVNLMSKVCL